MVKRKTQKIEGHNLNKKSQFLVQFPDAKRWLYPKEEGLCIGKNLHKNSHRFLFDF